MKYNYGYDDNLFTVSKVFKEFALIPGVGKFCACGCGGQVKGSIVTRTRLGVKQKYFLEPRANQLYAKKSCAKRLEYLRAKSKGVYERKPNIIRALINTNVIADKIPYRKLTIIHARKLTTELKITPKDKLLWDYIERICRYDGKNLQQKPLVELNVS